MIVEICNLDQSTVMATMMDDLLKNDLKKSLTKIYPQDFLDMLVRMENYVHTEEAFAEETPTSSVAVGWNKEHPPG